MDTIKEYAKYLQQCELSDGTIKVYIRHVLQFLEYLGNRHITKYNLIIYKNYLMKNRKVATVNLCIVSVNKYLLFRGYQDCIMKMEKMQKHIYLDNILTEEDYKKMLAYAKTKKKKYYYIMRTLALTGIRVSELQFFKVEVLEVGKIVVKNKGKTREVYIPDKLVYDLKMYCKEKGVQKGTIFKGTTDKPISRSAIYKGLIQVAQKTGIPKEKAHPHSFRHLFALTYMKQYSNISELADILGHSSIETTRIYTATTAEEKRQRMNLLDF